MPYIGLTDSDSLLAYRNIRIPDDVPIELKPAPGAGWGVFATRPIKKNHLILKETAIFTIMKSAGEQATENDVEKVWSKLSPSTKDALLPLRENGSQPLKSPFEIWSHNHLNLKNIIAEPYSKMNESVSLATTTGLFVLQSRINHSCLPNARRPWPLTTEDSTTLIAMRDIAAGEEITNSYVFQFHLRTRQERADMMGFDCNCKACAISDDNKEWQQMSDMRRRLLRGIYNHLNGADQPRPGVAWPPSIIRDPVLKRAAETYSIPLSKRFIYGLLFIVLTEEEGLLDDFGLGLIFQSVLPCPTAFKTKSNFEIADRAFQKGYRQKSWKDALGAALELDGRSDEADWPFAEKLRRERAKLTAQFGFDRKETMIGPIVTVRLN